MNQAAFLAALLLAGTISTASTEVVEGVAEGHPLGACSFPTHIRAAGWDFCWQQDDVRGQGVELNQVLFQGQQVLWKIGFPFSITQYDGNRFGPYKDTLGHGFLGDNPGFGLGSMILRPEDCPRILGEGVLLNDQKLCVETRGGPEPAVVVWARFNIFNYRFLQGYQLDSRGHVEPFVRLGGELADTLGGASVNHFHHLYWRVDFDVAASGNDTFQAYLRPDPAFGPFKPLADLPANCRQQVRDLVEGWCDVHREAALTHNPALFTRWRINDQADVNAQGRTRSFEAVLPAEGKVDGTFATFDAMGLQYKGDSAEIGYEVPIRPLMGDYSVRLYQNESEAILDPVAWFAVHAFHDPRDEEAPTMSYHDVRFTIRPRNFNDSNPGEDTYSASASPLPINPPPVQPPIGGGGIGPVVLP